MDYDKYQTKIDERFDLIPARPLQLVARTLGQGAEKYGEGNWKKIPEKSHLNHALAHIYKALELIDGDGVWEEDHITNAICRLLFAKYQAVVYLAEDPDITDYIFHGEIVRGLMKDADCYCDCPKQPGK